MIIVNKYICDTCSTMVTRRDNEVVKERLCDACGNQMKFLFAMELDDYGQAIKEYQMNGNVIDYKKPIKTNNSTASKPSVTCPYCNSTNCKKLGAISRGVSFGLFGFGSGKIGKQWHCNSCKSDF